MGQALSENDASLHYFLNHLQITRFGYTTTIGDITLPFSNHPDAQIQQSLANYYWQLYYEMRSEYILIDVKVATIKAFLAKPLATCHQMLQKAIEENNNQYSRRHIIRNQTNTLSLFAAIAAHHEKRAQNTSTSLEDQCNKHTALLKHITSSILIQGGYAYSDYITIRKWLIGVAQDNPKAARSYHMALLKIMRACSNTSKKQDISIDFILRSIVLSIQTPGVNTQQQMQQLRTTYHMVQKTQMPLQLATISAHLVKLKMKPEQADRLMAQMLVDTTPHLSSDDKTNTGFLLDGVRAMLTNKYEEQQQTNPELAKASQRYLRKIDWFHPSSKDFLKICKAYCLLQPCISVDTSSHILKQHQGWKIGLPYSARYIRQVTQAHTEPTIAPTKQNVLLAKVEKKKAEAGERDTRYTSMRRSLRSLSKQGASIEVAIDELAAQSAKADIEEMKEQGAGNIESQVTLQLEKCHREQFRRSLSRQPRLFRPAPTIHTGTLCAASA